MSYRVFARAVAISFEAGLRSKRWPRILTIIVVVLLGAPATAQTQENCNTALTRIAKKAAEKAVADHRDDACAGLKKGPFCIDKTKALELRSFSLCETGPVVAATITVHVRCATSDQALISADLEDDVTASASANLDTCKMLDADVSAGKFANQTGIQIANLKDKLRDAAAKQIRDYCK
jgi:hypothetical protein